MTEMGGICICEICTTGIEKFFPGNDLIICCDLEMVVKEEYFKERTNRRKALFQISDTIKNSIRPYP